MIWRVNGLHRRHGLALLALAILVIGGLLPGGAAPRAVAAGANGAIESLTLFHSSEHSDYYDLVYWSDGLRITGYVGIPKRDGPRPAIIYNRGGVWDAGKLTGVEIVPLVESGYVVAASQYRGNAGSEGGDQFGGADLNDVLNLITVLKQLPKVDASRIGMVGASRGGMMTYMALKWQTQTGRTDIKAAATVGGLADLNMWIEQRPELVEGLFLPIFGAGPEDAPRFYTERSALQWPHLINTPLLVVHGAADQEISVEQSKLLVEALLAAGKPVEFVLVPGADHALSAHWAGFTVILPWLQDRLGGGEDLSFETHQPAIEEVSRWFFLNHH
ncbi:MAG: S9 family peptidase [Anaerolineae bacterium]|nr:S9 family peptidase [Anaerolineae bacterium]